jgi:hypothetical protein
MNKDYVRYNLSEAQKALGDLIADMKSDPEYDYGNYVVDVAHVYHHLNTASNARDATKGAVDECSGGRFLSMAPVSSDRRHLSRAVITPIRLTSQWS